MLRTRGRCVALTLVMALGMWGPAAADEGPGQVERSLESPCKYPAGLATDGTSFYVADWRDGRIHVVSPADGATIRAFDAPTLKPHGLTFGDGRLWVSDDRTGWVYAMDPATGVVDRAFEAPGPNPTGLAFAGDTLFVLERKSGRTYEVIPDDGTILKYFAVPERTCTCIAWDGRYLWVADRIKDELYVVWPDDGTVLGIIKAPGPYPAGLAFLDGFLWNVDFQQRKLHQLAVRTDRRHRLSETRAARVEYLWTLYNYGPGEIRNVRVRFAVPGTLPQQELLSEIAYERPPARFETDRWGQRCAVFELPTIAAGTRMPLGFSVNAKVSAIRYLIFPDQCGTLDDVPPDIRERYTADGPRYRIASPFIRERVKQVVGDERNPYWIARKIFNHLIASLEYEMVGGWDVPEVVLKRGSGSCSEYTFAFIALCRAAGLPARYVGSIVVRGDDASVDEAFHRWAEVYLPGYGWVPVDANKGDAATPADQARGFGDLANRFLITTEGGGDSECLAWGYNMHYLYEAVGYCKVEEEHFGFWEPLETTTQPASEPAPATTATCDVH